MSAAHVAAVVAMDRERGIGKDGQLPWRLPGDMAHFKRVTTEAPPGKRNAVIMGRKTFESIPRKFRPLPGRLNIVLSRNDDYQPHGGLAARSFAHALELASADQDVADVLVIGGSSVYAAALADPRCDTLHVTRVDAALPCDAVFPPFEHLFECHERSDVHEEGGLCYTIEVHRRRR